MAETAQVTSIKQLFDLPEVARAGCLELSICDAVHFRLVKPQSVFNLAELRLRERDAELYAGFADQRFEVERALQGAPVRDKIDACCARQPRWLDVRQILYSTELEVWMDMSYPNPWTLQLYHAALMAGKVVSIPRLGPFSDTFHTLLKEKNGYEQTQPALAPEQTVRVYVGEQAFAQGPYPHLVTQRREGRTPPFAKDNSLGGQLAHGLLEKRTEDLSARGVDEDTYFASIMGYRKLGPALLVLLQAAGNAVGPVAFSGPGAELLAQLAERVRPVWPWMPELARQGQSSRAFSLVPGADAGISLFPAGSARSKDALVAFDDSVPVEILAPALDLFLKAAFAGPLAERIQAAAADFVSDYACMTRGLRVPLPVEPLTRAWLRQLLSPSRSFLEWAGASSHLPGFSGKTGLWRAVRRLERSPWPTGSYLALKPLARWWVTHRLTAKAVQIENAWRDYH